MVAINGRIISGCRDQSITSCSIPDSGRVSNSASSPWVHDHVTERAVKTAHNRCSVRRHLQRGRRLASGDYCCACTPFTRANTRFGDRQYALGLTHAIAHRVVRFCKLYSRRDPTLSTRIPIGTRW